MDKAARAALLTAKGIKPTNGKAAFQAGNHPDVPDVVYHNTNKDFSVFDPKKSSSGAAFGPGIYLSEDKEKSSNWNWGEGNNVMPLHVSVKNPLNIRKPLLKHEAEALNHIGLVSAKEGNPAPLMSMERKFGSIGQAAKAAGFDGLMHYGPSAEKHILVFEPEQVKSAIGNRGTFDPNDPDITKSGGGGITKGMDKTSENIADYVADLLRQGRAKEITDDLIEQADPQRLMHHYKSGNTGMDLPMDKASRMARAAQMGLTEDSLHGTAAGKDFSRFKGADRYGSRLGQENYVAPNTIDGRKLAAQFSTSDQGRVMPLLTPKPLDTSTLDDRLQFEKMMEDKNRMDDFRMKGGYRVSGLPSWGDQWAIDTVNEAGVPAMKLHERDWVTSTAVFDPTKMRSQFARFDPRLEHLAHLNASKGGAMEFARHVEAVNRAGGQIAPSKYLPDVPRQVHADGGRVDDARSAFLAGNHPDVPDVLYHGNAPKVATKGWTDEVDEEQTQKNRDAMGFHTFRPSEYGNFGPGIYLSDSPNVASNFAQGIRGENTEAKPYGQVFKLHVSMKQPFTDTALRHPAWKDYIKDEIKKALWLGGGSAAKDNAAAADIIAKLDNDTATVRDLFLRESPLGTMVNQFGQDKIHKTIRNSGFDGIIAHRPDGSKEYVAFKPEQVKSATGNQGTFDPNDPDITKAGGGSVTDSDEFRNWFGNSVTHTDGEPHVFYTGTSKDKDFTSFNVGRHGAWFTRDPALASEYAERNDSQGYKQDGWKLTPINTAGRVIPAYVKAENPYTGDLPDEVLRSNYKAAQSDWFDTLRRKGHDAWIPARHNGDLVVALKEPQQIKSIFNNGKFDPNQKHMNKSGGGSATGSLREKALWPSAQAIKAGTGSREAHAELVNKIKPVSPYAAPVSPASDEQVHDALTKDKQPKAFAPRGLEEGTPVAVRLDIPAYEKKNTWVVSVHHPKTDFTAGEVIGYDSVAHIGNPRFGVHPTGALNIASGKPKSTIATVHGNWKKTTPEDAFALSQTIHNDPQWRQVGMDPERHSYFYDRETQEPVMAADEALHIGPLVYAKNPVYEKKTDFAFSKGGDVSAAIALTRRFTKDGAGATMALKPKGK